MNLKRWISILAILLLASTSLPGCSDDADKSQNDENGANAGLEDNTDDGSDADDENGDDDVDEDKDIDEGARCTVEEMTPIPEDQFSGGELSLEGEVEGIDVSEFSYAAYSMNNWSIPTIAIDLGDTYHCRGDRSEPGQGFQIVLPALGEGTFDVNTEGGYVSNQTTVNVSLGSFHEVDGEIKSKFYLHPVAGTVTFDRFDFKERPFEDDFTDFDGIVSGSVDLEFPNGETVTGTFTAPYCMQCL